MQSAKHTGTQTIARSLALLRELAAHGEFGWGLSDLAGRCGLDKATAHRLLAQLKRERMVQQRASDRRYVPGPLLYELSLSLPAHAAFRAAADPVLERLARRLRAVAFLCLRSGSEFVCAARTGSVPRRSLSLVVGTRRPLLASAGGIAMMLALPRDEARAVAAANKAMMRPGAMSTSVIERMLRESERRGMGVNEQNVIPGWNAYGVPIRDVHGRPFASIMVAGEATHFSAAAHPDLTSILHTAAHDLARDAARLFPATI